MAQKLRNPLAQTLGIVLQGTRDKMGGVSSSEVAASLGLAASHYRMVEAGSAILQSARTVKIVQTFGTIEFVPLCQVLVAIQVVDSAKQSVDDMRTIVGLLKEANPAMSKVLAGFDELWPILGKASAAEVSQKIAALGIDKELNTFLTTEPAMLSSEQITDFMTPTYQHPISGQLYDKIGNILQGVAPFYLDTVLQLVDNLKNITPRVTPQELARWEGAHKSRISYIIGIIRKPEIVLDVEAFDYTFLWEENFSKVLIVHRDRPETKTESIFAEIKESLRSKLQSERVKYDRQLQDFDEVLSEKFQIEDGYSITEKIDELLLHRDVQMNNLWIYIMVNGYVVPFIDNAVVGSKAADIYGTSLDYDETCKKLVSVREICANVGFTL